MACGGSLLHTLLVTVLSASIALFTLWRLSASFISSGRTAGAKAGAKHKAGKASAKQRTPVLSVAHKEMCRRDSLKFDFEGGRHQRRIDQIADIENGRL